MCLPKGKHVSVHSTSRCGEATVDQVLSYQPEAHTCPAFPKQQAVGIGVINMNMLSGGRLWQVGRLWGGWGSEGGFSSCVGRVC